MGITCQEEIGLQQEGVEFCIVNLTQSSLRPCWITKRDEHNIRWTIDRWVHWEVTLMYCQRRAMLPFILDTWAMPPNQLICISILILSVLYSGKALLTQAVYCKKQFDGNLSTLITITLAWHIPILPLLSDLILHLLLKLLYNGIQRKHKRATEISNDITWDRVVSPIRSNALAASRNDINWWHTFSENNKK